MNPKDAGFDRIAWCYDLLASLVFANRLKASQCAFLNVIPKGAHVLIIGGGTGWILKELFKYALPDKVTYLEASSKMLSLSKQKLRVEEKDKVDFVLGNEENIPQTRKYEVVITCYFLDVFAQERMESVMYKLCASLKESGWWIFADFQNRTPRSPLSTLLLKCMYLFFRILCNMEAKELPDFQKGFSALPLQLKRSEVYYFHMIKAGLFQKTEKP